MEQEIKEGYNIVIYTDGAAKGEIVASRGYYGSGYFGYVYSRESIGKNTKSLPTSVNPTTLGFMTPELSQQDAEFYKKSQPVQPVKYIIGSIPGTEINTNNYAEAYALYKAIKAILNIDLDVKNILFKLDSNMLIYVLTEMISNPDADMSRYAFPDLYNETYNDIKTLKSKGIELRVKHVYGHSGSFGNNIADRLAFLGRTKSEETDNKATGIELIVDSNPDRDDFWSDLELSPYIFGNTLYFLPPDEERNPYLILNYSKDQEIGEKDGEVLMGSIYSGIEDNVLKSITEKHINLKPDYGNIFALDIGNVKHYMTNFFFKLDGFNIFTKNNRPGNLTVLEEYPIVRTIKPGSLAMQLIDNLFIHREILDIIKLEEHNTYEVIDITNMFYTTEEDKKGKIKTECIMSRETKDIIIPNEFGDIHLIPRVDIPPRDYFKRLCSLENIKVYLVTKLLSDKCKEYYTVVKGSEGDDKVFESVWCNNYSNKIYKTK